MINNRVQSLLDLGLSTEAVVDILSRLPRLLGYQSSQLQAMGGYLTGLSGLSKAELAIILQREPRLLTYSVGGMSPSSLAENPWCLQRNVPTTRQLLYGDEEACTPQHCTRSLKLLINRVDCTADELIAMSDLQQRGSTALRLHMSHCYV